MSDPNDTEFLAKAASGRTALFADKFFVSMGPVCRIVFGQFVGGDTTVIFHSAIVMTREDAGQLRDLLNRLLTMEPKTDEKTVN